MAKMTSKDKLDQIINSSRTLKEAQKKLDRWLNYIGRPKNNQDDIRVKGSFHKAHWRKRAWFTSHQANFMTTKHYQAAMKKKGTGKRKRA